MQTLTRDEGLLGSALERIRIQGEVLVERHGPRVPGQFVVVVAETLFSQGPVGDGQLTPGVRVQREGGRAEGEVGDPVRPAELRPKHVVDGDTHQCVRRETRAQQQLRAFLEDGEVVQTCGGPCEAPIAVCD